MNIKYLKDVNILTGEFVLIMLGFLIFIGGFFIKSYAISTMIIGLIIMLLGSIINFINNSDDKKEIFRQVIGVISTSLILFFFANKLHSFFIKYLEEILWGTIFLLFATILILLKIKNNFLKSELKLLIVLILTIFAYIIPTLLKLENYFFIQGHTNITKNRKYYNKVIEENLNNIEYIYVFIFFAVLLPMIIEIFSKNKPQNKLIKLDNTINILKKNLGTIKQEKNFAIIEFKYNLPNSSNVYYTKIKIPKYVNNINELNPIIAEIINKIPLNMYLNIISKLRESLNKDIINYLESNVYPEYLRK